MNLSQEENELTLPSLYTWINKLQEEDLQQVRIEITHGGVAPGTLKTILYSADEEDLHHLYQMLFSSVVKESSENLVTPGAEMIQYDYKTNSESYSIVIAQHLVKVEGQYYRLLSKELTQLNDPFLTCHSFVTFSDTCTAYRLNDEKIDEFPELCEMEFVQYTGDLDTLQYLGYLKFDFFTLKVYDQNVFSIDNETRQTFYQTIDSISLSSLFD